MKPVIIIAIIAICGGAAAVGYFGYTQYTTDVEALQKQLKDEKWEATVKQNQMEQDKRDALSAANKKLASEKASNLAEQEKVAAKAATEKQQAEYKAKLTAQAAQAKLREQEYQAEQQERQLQDQIETKERQRIIEKARTNPVLQGIIDGTLDFYIEPIPAYYKVPGIHGAVEDIASSLDRTFYGVDIRRTYSIGSADIVISWVKDFGSSKLGHATFKKFVEVELGSDKCWGAWQPYDTNTIKKVMWHEIGHSLGMQVSFLLSPYSKSYDNRCCK